MRVANSVKNISAGLISQVLTYAFSFVVRTVFISYLGKTYLGISGLFTNVLSILSFAELGIGSAIVYNLYKPLAVNDWDKIRAYINFYKKAYIIIGLIVLLMGISFTPFLPYIIKGKTNIPNLSLIYVLFVINSSVGYFFAYRFTVITASQKGYVLAKIGYFFNVLASVLQIIILVLTRNYIVVLSMQICVNIAQNCYNSYKATILYPEIKNLKGSKLEKKELKQIFRDVRALVIYKIGGTLVSSTDNIIISIFVGVVAVGLYSNYVLIISAVGAFLGIIFNSIGASIGNLNATEDKAKKYFMFNVVNFASFWLYGVCSIIILLTASPFIKVWLGPSFVMSPVIIVVVIINFYIDGMLNAVWTYRQTMGLFVHGKYRPLISAVINLAFSVILARRFGIVGVFIGTTITRITTNIWFDPYIVFKNGFNLSVKGYYFSYIKFLTVVIGTAVFTSFIVYKLLVFNGLVNVFCIALIGLICSNSIFYIIFRKTEELKYLSVTFCGFFKCFKRKF